jgi:hypothetical protein
MGAPRRKRRASFDRRSAQKLTGHKRESTAGQAKAPMAKYFGQEQLGKHGLFEL